ncbi:MAG: site-2 protease family protein [Christensenellaceae bacterium]|nr:site-2 protease family protein [Christensenellaceae bacterium]
MYLIQMFQTDPRGALIYLLSILLAMCVAISFHEWAHAFVADKLGDPTAKLMGRMSLDPLRHLDWIGMACFVFFRIGWAKPVIVNHRNLKHFRRDDVLISLAGPVTNLILSFVFYGVWFFLCLVHGIGGNVLSEVLATICSVNLSFAVFNVLPIPPLDGFHVVTSLFVRKSYKVVQFLERYGFIILIVLLFSGVLDVVLDAVFGAVSSLFFSFFALFL